MEFDLSPLSTDNSKTQRYKPRKYSKTYAAQKYGRFWCFSTCEFYWLNTRLCELECILYYAITDSFTTTAICPNGLCHALLPALCIPQERDRSRKRCCGQPGQSRPIVSNAQLILAGDDIVVSQDGLMPQCW